MEAGISSGHQGARGIGYIHAQAAMGDGTQLNHTTQVPPCHVGVVLRALTCSADDPPGMQPTAPIHEEGPHFFQRGAAIPICVCRPVFRIT